MGFLRKHKGRENITEDFGVEPDKLAQDAVVDFKHRLYEDSDFRDDLGATLRDAVERHKERTAAESKAHATAYGDKPDSEFVVTDDLHALRGDAFLAIVQLLRNLVEPEPHWQDGPSPTETLNGIREAVGELAYQAYFQGQIEPPMQLRQGAMGVYYKDFGTVVVWENVRGYESQLDQLSELGPFGEGDAEPPDAP